MGNPRRPDRSLKKTAFDLPPIQVRTSGGRTKKAPSEDGAKMFPAITYFRTGGHYHRPCKLNGRVRNGNVCFLAGKVTGIRRSASKAAFFCVKKSKCSKKRFRYCVPQIAHLMDANWQSIKVVKHSSVSTGQLKRLHALHSQPINLVVFQGSSGASSNET